MRLTSLLLLLGIVGSFATTVGATPKTCKTVYWKPGDVVELDAQLYKQIHITLPENSLDVIMGDKEMWTYDWISNHIFIKPASAVGFAKVTTLSAIGASGNAYEFIINRVDSTGPIIHCTTLVAEGELIDRSVWKDKTDKDKAVDKAKEDRYKQSLNILEKRLATAEKTKKEAAVDLERQGKDALKKYRKQIYTQYSWTGATGFFASAAKIDSVYDDGRYTFVRLANDATGLMSIMGELDGKQELLEFVYDAPTHIYQVSGIFPKFIMRAGESEVLVLRKLAGE